MKTGNLNFLEPFGPFQAYNGTAAAQHGTELQVCKTPICIVYSLILLVQEQWRTEGGFGEFKLPPLPTKSRRPSKIVPNSPRL